MIPFVGELACVPYNFAPPGWFLCHGQPLPIAEYDALFALIGTTYGGDGLETFNLPDLRGRVPIGFGQGPGLSSYPAGTQVGSEYVTVTVEQCPAHNHDLMCSSAAGTQTSPANHVPAKFSNGDPAYHPATDGASMNADMLSLQGGSQPHENRQPYLTLNWIIAHVGIFPIRG